jgi:transcriptional regulator with XRE-family HTH domain
MREARTARGLSMHDLVRAASPPDSTMSHATVSLIESGRQATLDAVTAVRLARVLGVTVEWLVDGPT